MFFKTNKLVPDPIVMVFVQYNMLRLKTNLQPIRSIFDAVFISICYACFTVLPIITVDKYKTKTEKKKNIAFI